MIRIGLLGCGRIGQIHGRNVKITQGAILIALYDPNMEMAQSLAAETGAEIRSYEGVVEANDIDALLICTSTTTHYDIIHHAAAAGKAIFCEKPFDLSLKRSQECVETAQNANVPLMIAFNRRFDPHFATLQRRLHDGEIGNVELITILSRDPAPPPNSILATTGGLFCDMMIHDFDMVRFLLGEEPVKLYACGSALVNPEIAKTGDIDTASVTLKTASGKICQISNSRQASYGYDQRIEVHGSKGMLRAGNLLENSVEIATASGFQRAPAQHFFLERYEKAYCAEILHFVQSLVDNIPLTPNGQDGLRAQMMANAAALSCQNGEMQCLDI